MAKKVIVAVTTDLVTDQRVHKVCTSLQNEGFEIVLVGRQMKKSLPLASRTYKTHRFKLIFEKGPLFYASFNIRLFLFLLFNRADILLANDLDTLLAVYLASKIKNTPMAYDNHEYFTGVPELSGRPFVRGIWKTIERKIFPRLKYIYTESESKRKLFENEYKVSVSVIRNLPLKFYGKPDIVKKPEWVEDRKVILYQGAVNKDRGIEEMVEAMQFLDGYIFLIIGNGDLFEHIQNKVLQLGLSSKVRMPGLIPFDDLPGFTRMADVGISIEKDTNISYKNCLPNKIFDYINAGVPVLVSKLPEMKLIVEKYNVGAFIDSHESVSIADTIKIFFSDPDRLALWKSNLSHVTEELNWENEEKVLLCLFNKISAEADE
jgi:glycosyltransferase involved in cell wall biosynthesis